MARNPEKLKSIAQRAGDYDKFNSADRWWSKLLASLNTWLNPDHAWFDYGSEEFEGTFDNLENKYLEKGLTAREREANAFSAEEAQKSRDWQEYMARNKYAIETQSMQDAGVNPAMVYGGGNLVPTASNGAHATSVAPAGGLAELLPQIMALVRMPLEMKAMQAEIDKTSADTENVRTQTEGTKLQNEITEGTKNAIIKVTNMQPEEKRATIDNILQNTKSEEVKTEVLGVQLLQDKLDYEQNKRMYDLMFEMQRMQNSYQEFVNNHQERQWNAEYNKICAEVNDLYASARKKMSDIEVNNADIALKGAQTGLVGQQTVTELENTKLTRTKNKHEAVQTWKDYNDPKAHLVRSVVDPMNGIHNIFSGMVERGRELTNKAHRKGEARQRAERLQEMYSTFGQAYEEFGDIQ